MSANLALARNAARFGPVQLFFPCDSATAPLHFARCWLPSLAGVILPFFEFSESPSIAGRAGSKKEALIIVLGVFTAGGTSDAPARLFYSTGVLVAVRL